MKKTKTSKALKMGLVFISSFLVASCGTNDKPNSPNYEFYFEGGGVFSDNVDYHVTLVGNKDKDKTLLLKVKEMPALELTGHWVLVENKGYKVYFDDSDNSFAYSRYDVNTKTFTIKYKLNLGGGQGRNKITLNYKDENFANYYDGEGLPPLPPTFTGYGWNGTNRHDCILSCFEDGTCVSITDKSGVPNRLGTYKYDTATNTYSFEFENEESHYPANYITNIDGVQYYRYDWTVLGGNDPTIASHRENLPLSEGFPQFTNKAFYYNENNEKVWFDFKTTYDETTKTYDLYYEAYSKGLQVRHVTYTVDD